MISLRKHRAASLKQLRSFGLVVAAGFLVIGLWPLVFRHQPVRSWSLAITLIFGISGLLVPAVLRYPYQVWMFVGDCLGWVNSRIILGGLFYLIVTPTGFFMSLAGHDPMNRKFDANADSYRVKRKPRESGHMTHQF